MLFPTVIPFSWKKILTEKMAAKGKGSFLESRNFAGAFLPLARGGLWSTQKTDALMNQLVAKGLKVSLLIGLGFGSRGAFAQSPLPQAHAHNDYEHERPLLDALDQGFTSVEADVHLIDGRLIVAHDRPSRPDTSRTLAQLYLRPLWERTAGGAGAVYPDSGWEGPFLLMIDFKTGAGPTYEALQAALEPFRAMLARVEDGREIAGPVLVFISGSRPVEAILEADSYVARLDGRPSDLGQGIPATRMPVISQHWRQVVRWRGRGRPSARVREQLTDYVARIHAEGKRVRLWASPDRPKVWQALLDSGADLINTDDLAGLREFLMSE